MRIALKLLALAAATLPASAHAQEWWAFADSGAAPDRQISFGDLAGNFSYGDGVMGWRVTAFERAGADGATYRREQWHFFCKTRTMALYYWETSDALGRRIASQRLQDEEIRYVPVASGTMDDKFRRLYCEDPEESGAQPISVDYRTYRDQHFSGAR